MSNLALPYGFDTTGRTATTDLADHIRDMILQILLTSPGERVMRPTFGAGLRRYLMDPNTPSTRAQIALDVQAALQTWEPRITVTSVQVVPGDDPAEALVTVTYVHVRDQTPGSIGVTVQTAGNGGVT